MTRQIWRAVRPFRWIAIVIVVYLLSHFVLSQISSHRGILTPNGNMDLGYAIFAIFALALRFIVLVVFPIRVIYSVVMSVGESIIKRL
jgi:hypothetical protein